MASLMDMIMMQRAGMDDPRAAANMQAMELQNMARTAQQPAASSFGNLPPPAFAGGLPPVQSFAPRAPMMMGAPMPQMLSAPSVPPLEPMRDIGAAPGMGSPMTQPRPSAPIAPAGAPMQLASAAPSVRESFMQRLLSGPNYQSNSMPVMPQGATTPQQINWGDPESAADFVRANQAYMGLLG